MHGARYTNTIVNQADLLLAFGVRFDDRATGRVDAFCSHATIVHVDIDHSEINKIKRATLSMVSDVGAVLRRLTPRIRSDRRLFWNRQIEKIKLQYPSAVSSSADFFRPHTFIKQLARFVRSDTIIATDVGQHQMWIAQSYPFTKPRTLLTSGGLGTMGFGMPAAIGAALAKPKSRVVCVSGDGSLLMNIQELATLADLNLDITIIVMNNQHLGLVRQQQELFYGGRYYASQFNSKPDFVTIAAGFGIAGVDLKKSSNPMQSLQRSLTGKGPCVVNLPVHHAENVYPMVPPGGANHEMIEFEETPCAIS
jgi:acetolactate synthase-1/2/3 large subunit